MPVRNSMSDLIARVRLMINDPSGTSPHFLDQDIQDSLDFSGRMDIRYEALAIAPSIVNLPSTHNIPSTIFADYYSAYQFWESDAVLQGQDTQGNAWKILTPTTSDYLVGHWTFEASVFTSGTVPGQYPPVFCTGKVFDIFLASAQLLENWAASLSCAYDVTVDGQMLKRSQLMQAKLQMAQAYRRQAKPLVAQQARRDVALPVSSRQLRLLDDNETIKGY